MQPLVFAVFRADVRVIDATKRAALQRLLLASVTSTAPGEKLDEKLATLALDFDSMDCERGDRGPVEFHADPEQYRRPVRTNPLGGRGQV